MTNSLNNEYGNLITICPYCKSKNIIQFPIVDIFIYIDLDETLQSITLRKKFSKKPETEQYLKTLIIDGLKRKPILARIIITKPYHDVINELIKKGFLTDRDLKNINNY